MRIKNESPYKNNLFNKIKKTARKSLVHLLIGSTLTFGSGCSTYLGYNDVTNFEVLETKYSPQFSDKDARITRFQNFRVNIRTQKMKEEVYYKYNVGGKIGEIIAAPFMDGFLIGPIDFLVKVFGGKGMHSGDYAQNPPSYFTRLSQSYLTGLLNPFQCVMVISPTEKSLKPLEKPKTEWKRADEALSELEKALTEGVTSKTDTGTMWFTIGTIYAKAGFFDTAVRNYKVAAAINKDFAYKGYVELGIASLDRGWYDYAKQEFEMALKEKPDETEPHRYLAVVYASTGLDSKAIEELEAVVKKEPRDLDSHLGLARLYERKNLEDKALEEYKTAIKIKPDNASVYYTLGNMYAKKSNREEAEKAWKTAIRLKPDFADAHHNLAVNYYEKREYDKALKEWEEVRRTNPNYPNIDKNIGIVKAKLKKN